ncbi:GAF domain-containing protein [Botrimarina colliarenosi]|uniref:GAF domain-containing protein n=1 Tax=Botrimarina colliarenosi TaxID=2528001 RepID=UPI0011B3EF03|nr:GAF domain-containing protein [Botrimarina colliarenosi]
MVALWALFAQIATLLGGWWKRTASRDHEPLDGVLEMLLEALHGRNEEATKGDLRVAIFVPENRDRSGVLTSVRQLTDYASRGDADGKGARRTMPVFQGVVGNAFQTGAAVYDRLPAGMTVTDYLVRAHRFDRQQASQMRQDRRSWAAMPVGSPGEVVAVIFLDSKVPDFFGKKNGPVRKIVESAAIPVANFLDVR